MEAFRLRDSCVNIQLGSVDAGVHKSHDHTWIAGSGGRRVALLLIGAKIPLGAKSVEKICGKKSRFLFVSKARRRALLQSAGSNYYAIYVGVVKTRRLISKVSKLQPHLAVRLRLC